MGLPGDTEKTVQKSIDFAKLLNDKFNLKNYLQFNTVIPSLGSIYHKQMRNYDIEINKKIDYSFWVNVPTVSSSSLPYDKHLELWHKVWQIFFPDYYDLYLKIEDFAFRSEDPLLDKFRDG